LPACCSAHRRPAGACPAATKPALSRLRSSGISRYNAHTEPPSCRQRHSCSAARRAAESGAAEPCTTAPYQFPLTGRPGQPWSHRAQRPSARHGFSRTGETRLGDDAPLRWSDTRRMADRAIAFQVRWNRFGRDAHARHWVSSRAAVSIRRSGQRRLCLAAGRLAVTIAGSTDEMLGIPSVLDRHARGTAVAWERLTAGRCGDTIRLTASEIAVHAPRRSSSANQTLNRSLPPRCRHARPAGSPIHRRRPHHGGSLLQPLRTPRTVVDRTAAGRAWPRAAGHGTAPDHRRRLPAHDRREDS